MSSEQTDRQTDKWTKHGQSLAQMSLNCKTHCHGYISFEQQNSREAQEAILCSGIAQLKNFCLLQQTYVLSSKYEGT